MSSKATHDIGQDLHKYNIHSLLQTSQFQPTPNFSIHQLSYTSADLYQPPKLADTYQPPKLTDAYQPPKLADTYQPPKLTEPYQPPKQADPYEPSKLADAYQTAKLPEAYQPLKLPEMYQPAKLDLYHPPKIELTKLTPTMEEADNAADAVRKLDTVCAVLKAMICQEGSSSASVHRFVEMFQKISWNQTQLEEALQNFGTTSQGKEIKKDIDTANQNQDAADNFEKSIKQESFEKREVLTAGHYSQNNLTFNGYGKENVGPDIFDQINNIEIVKKKPEAVAVLEVPAKQAEISGGTKRKVQPCPTPRAQQTTTPRGGGGGAKRARRVCGTCPACVNRPTTPDCQACNNCLDQKRYGGPGKLKKACIKRLCVLVLKPHEQQQLQQNGGARQQLQQRSRSPPDVFDETSNTSTVSTGSSSSRAPAAADPMPELTGITTNSTGQMVLSAPAYNVESGTVSFTFAPMVTGAGGTPVFNIIPNISTSAAGATSSVAPVASGPAMSMSAVASGPAMSMPVFSTQVLSEPGEEQRVLDCREF